MGRKEKPVIGMHFNNCRRDNAGDEEGAWTKVVSKKTAKDMKKILKVDNQTQNQVVRGQHTRYYMNWRDKDDITSYFTHFPIKRGRSEGKKCSALLVIRESLEISEKIWFREENPSRGAFVTFP